MPTATHLVDTLIQQSLDAMSFRKQVNFTNLQQDANACFSTHYVHLDMAKCHFLSPPTSCEWRGMDRPRVPARVWTLGRPLDALQRGSPKDALGVYHTPAQPRVDSHTRLLIRSSIREKTHQHHTIDPVTPMTQPNTLTTLKIRYAHRPAEQSGVVHKYPPSGRARVERP